MAVNGIEIQVGQVWKQRDGQKTKIVRRCDVDTVYPWDTEHDSVTTTGSSYLGAIEEENDLVELVSGPGFVPKDEILALTPAEAKTITLPLEQRSNPKDSIGDKKLPLHLLSPIAEAHWAIGQYAGTLKYGAWNWRSAGVRASVYISAARRHLAAYLSGEEFDPIDGSHHLGNVMACCAILLDAREIGKLTDDRPPSYSVRPTYKWAEDQMAALKVQYADMAPRHFSIADTEVKA